MSLSRGKVIFGVIAVALAAYATWPDDQSLDYKSCEPKGIFSELSATLYGKSFWEQARARAHSFAVGIEELDKDFAKMLDPTQAQRERDARDQDLYAKFPEMAPSPAERAAQRLRDQADRIESQEIINRQSAIHQKMISDARRCEAIISQKLRAM
jgi:hypothetical protein